MTRRMTRAFADRSRAHRERPPRLPVANKPSLGTLAPFGAGAVKAAKGTHPHPGRLFDGRAGKTENRTPPGLFNRGWYRGGAK